MIFVLLAVLLAITLFVMIYSSKKRYLVAQQQTKKQAYKKALSIEKSEEKKKYIFKAESGHLPTQLYLAKEAEKTNPKEALYWYEHAAMQDSDIAMYSIVRICGQFAGDIILSEKSKFWQLAIEAKKGDDAAALTVGKALIGGKAVTQDLDKGIAMIQTVAEKGNPQAQLFMGDWYVSKSNAQPDEMLASEWYFRAAQQGEIEAQIKLAEHYRDGVGVPQNLVRASYWFELAAEKGEALAQYHSGLVWHGQSDSGNAIAYIWFYLSDYYGHSPAKTMLDELAVIIPVRNIVQLQNMAKLLIGKINDKSMKKHTLIKALNRSYQRESYFPDVDGNEFVLYQTNDQVEEEKLASEMDI